MSDKNPMSNWAAAYTKAWAEVQNVVKNAHNPHFKSNYADLGAVLDTIREVFGKYGLALLQAPGPIVEVGGYLVQKLQGVLIHSSGEMLNMSMDIPLGPVKSAAPVAEVPGGDWKAKKSSGGEVTAQKSGGVITYARRYQLASVGGIAQVDDDGNASSGRTESESAPEADHSDLVRRIAACTDPEVLNGTGTGKTLVKSVLRREVEATNDQKVTDLFLAKRNELKEPEKTKKKKTEGVA